MVENLPPPPPTEKVYAIYFDNIIVANKIYSVMAKVSVESFCPNGKPDKRQILIINGFTLPALEKGTRIGMLLIVDKSNLIEFDESMWERQSNRFLMARSCLEEIDAMWAEFGGKL